MDFRYHYSDEQERFRQEVQAWLRANLTGERSSSPSAVTPVGLGPLTSIAALLGELGWLALTETYDSGLKQDLRIVLLQELEGHGLLWLAREITGLLQAIEDYGSSDQHQSFLPAIARGELVCWTPSRSSESTIDPASAPVQVTRDGDDYILDGTDLFLGTGSSPDYLCVPAISDPEGPSPFASAFLVLASLDGVSISTPRRLTQGHEHQVTFDQVRVPPYCLLGDEGGGWALSSSLRSLDMEPLPPLTEDLRVSHLLEYASETLHEGVPLSSEPNRQQLLMQAYIDSRLASLLRRRDAWMKSTGQELTYHVAQTRDWERRATERLAEISRTVVGMYAMLDSDDPHAPSLGSFEYVQRLAVAEGPPESDVAGDVAIIANALGFGGHVPEVAGAPQSWDEDHNADSAETTSGRPSPLR